MSEESQPIALITGAAKRIGHHLALSLAKQGWDIAGHYNTSDEDIKILGNKVEALGQSFLDIKADLNDTKAITKIVSTCRDNLGVPSLLINNASLFINDKLEEFDEATYDRHLAINLKAPMLLMRDFLEISKTQDHNDEQSQNNIINITDQRTHSPKTDFFTYTVSKIALANSTELLAKAASPYCRVNAIAPGPVLQSIHQSAAEFEKECKSTLLKRGTSLEEIASAMNFILNTPSMTGETLHLDGGQRLS